MINKEIRNIALSALFLALGIVLPFVTGQIPQIGNMLLPMHIPVLICGLICGWKYGLLVGFVLPILRYLLFGMPPLFPVGIPMSFEMAAYGFLSGYIYNKVKGKNLLTLYLSLIIAMVGGRVVYGIVRVIMMGLGQAVFSWQLFIAEAFVNALPGIILQLTLIPLLMFTLDRIGVVKFSK